MLSLLAYLPLWADHAQRVNRIIGYSRESSISALTEPSYLPTPRPIRSADPFAFIGNVSTICGLIAEHAEHSIPATFTLEPNRACIAWEVSYLFGHATDQGTIDSSDRRTFRRVLESLNVCGILNADEWESAPIVAERLAGQILGEATATSKAPNVLTTTKGHQRGLDGTVRTFRAHMPIVGGNGTVCDALALVAQADTLLRMFSPDGTIGDLALLGTQDRMGGDQNAGATGEYGPNGELRKHTPAGHGNGNPDSWHVLRSVDWMETEQGALKMVPTWKAIDVGNKYNCRGQLTYRGGDGRRAESLGKVKRPTIRGSRKPISFDVRGWANWRTLNVYTTTYNGRRATGHEWASYRTSGSGVRPTSKRARVARQKATPEVVKATDAANRAHEMALSLYNTHASKVGHTPEANNHASLAPKRFKLKTEAGTEVHIGITPRGYDVVIIDAEGKRKRTSTTAPEYVESIVRNRLALIG